MISLNTTMLAAQIERLVAKSNALDETIKTRLNWKYAPIVGLIVVVTLVTTFVVGVMTRTVETLTFTFSWWSAPVWLLLILSVRMTMWWEEEK